MKIEYEDHNPYHDPKTGRFTTGPGGRGAGTLKSFQKRRAAVHKAMAGRLSKSADEEEKKGNHKTASTLRARAAKHTQMAKDYTTGKMTKGSAAAKRVKNEEKGTIKKAPPKPKPKVEETVGPKSGTIKNIKSFDSQKKAKEVKESIHFLENTPNISYNGIQLRKYEEHDTATPVHNAAVIAHKTITALDGKLGAARYEVDIDTVTPYDFCRAQVKIYTRLEPGGREKLVGTISRTTRSRDNSVEHEFFKLDEQLQGQGIGASVIRSQVESYKQMGIDRVDVHAALNAGGYTWLRHGFVTNSKEGGDRLAYEATTRRVGRFPENEQPAYKKMLDKVRDAQTTKPEQEKILRALAASPRGRELFAGLDWAGHLDLNNQDHLDALDSYTSKRK